MAMLKVCAQQVVRTTGVRWYKTAVHPKNVHPPPELVQEQARVSASLREERRENEELEGGPRDPTQVFLQQGRHLLQSIDDGGDVHLVKDTGVPGVFAIELENPEHANAMTANMMCRFEEVVREINKHPECVAVVLRGVGVEFCSGAHADLAKVHLLSAERGLRMCRYMQTLLLEFHNLPCITVAAIEGGAVGGGAELATACDFRIVSEKGNVHFVHTHLGLSTGWGGGTRLTKLVGRRAAILLLCSGKPCAPKDATAFGLVDRVVPEGDTYRDALNFIKTNFLKAPSEAVKGCKDIIAAAEILTPRTALLYEQKIFAALWARNARTKSVATTSKLNLLKDA
ncbi:3-hydroxypropionyl-coenzyme A dehydratase [Diplonema papillatum]|nr:3-hydroxypropionyl-coenzyme A dehydratase [Diplonema papillatum]